MVRCNWLEEGVGEEEGNRDLHPSVFGLLWAIVLVAMTAAAKILLGVLNIMYCRNKTDLGAMMI